MVIEPRPRRRRHHGAPDLAVAAEAVAANILLAAKEASGRLTELGIDHVLIGGIAVGAHGAPRATKDVDFLVRQRQVFTGSLILSFREGVPIAVRDVVVDYLTPEGDPHEAILRRALESADASEGVPIIGLTPLVVMKLEAGRRRDLDDVRRLLEGARAEDTVRAFIAREAPGLLPELERALRDD